MSHGSPVLILSFTLLLLVTLTVALFIAARWGDLPLKQVAPAIGAWLVLCGALAFLGILGHWELRPPPAMVLFVTGIVGSALLSRRPWARRLGREAPVAVLVGFQAFRLPLELIMHRAYSEGIMPIQMSFSGRNFDIVTGVLAIAIGLWASRGRVPRAALWAFNIIGLSLLINIVGIAVVSMPLIAAFGPDQLNVWVTWLPYVWLPTVFVTFALFGHLLLLQRLRDSPA